MNRANEPWYFRRRVVQACLRKTAPNGHGVRRPERTETPLSNEEIFFGACHGIIRVPPLAAHPTHARAHAFAEAAS
ncbi:hypothetical protein D9M72_598730 [compost metagenome]